jgi:hypothetical protein
MTLYALLMPHADAVIDGRHYHHHYAKSLHCRRMRHMQAEDGIFITFAARWGHMPAAVDADTSCVLAHVVS